MRNVRLLFLGGGPLMPTSQPMEMLKYEYFSKYFHGDIITSIMHPKHMVIKSIGNFQYHPFVLSGNTVVRNIKLIGIYLKKVLELYRRNGKYDVIIASNPLLGGFTALVIGRIIGAKVIVEVNGNFESAFKYGRKGETNPSRIESVKELYSKMTIPFFLKRADMVKFVSDRLMKPLNIKPNSIHKKSFTDFVPINKFIEIQKSDNKYILLLGYPWFLKGVDILIKAFTTISDEFPEYRLKIVGWCPEKEYYRSLAGNNQRIELCDPVYYEGVIPLMAGSSLYVLASRTDALPRVLIEAMASRKPIIASNVDGVPDLISDGYNGLMFEKENVGDLANKIRYLLSHPEEAGRLAENGFQYVQEHLSEECYINNYKKMIDECLDS